jgi:RNA polymerase sigma-70 factor (ECF subfamily)
MTTHDQPSASEKEARFREAVASYRERISRVCRWYVSDPEDRKDVFQQILVNIWCSLDSFESRSQIGTWIYRIAVNTCLGHVRSQGRRRVIFDHRASVEAEAIPDPADEAVQVRMEADIRLLNECVAKLEPVNRALISLYLEDVPTKEIAEILGISEVNARVKLHRVRNSLKELMQRRGYGTD